MIFSDCLQSLWLWKSRSNHVFFKGLLLRMAYLKAIICVLYIHWYFTLNLCFNHMFRRFYYFLYLIDLRLVLLNITFLFSILLKNLLSFNNRRTWPNRLRIKFIYNFLNKLFNRRYQSSINPVFENKILLIENKEKRP